MKSEETEAELRARYERQGGVWTGYQRVGLVQKHLSGHRTTWCVVLYEILTKRKGDYWTVVSILNVTSYSGDPVYARHHGPPSDPPTFLVEFGRKLAAEKGLPFDSQIRHNVQLDPLESLALLGRT